MKANFLTILFFLSALVFPEGKITPTKLDFDLSASMNARRNVCLNANGEKVTFTGIDGNAPYSFTYTVDGGAEQTVISPSDADTATLDIPTTTARSITYTLVSVRDTKGTEVTIDKKITVTVNDLPSVDFNFDDSIAYCSGDSIVFNSIVSGVGPFTYFWEFGDGGTSSDENPSYAFTALGCAQEELSVRLTVTDDNGCQKKSIAKNVTVFQKPNIAFTDENNPLEPFNNCGNVDVDNPDYIVMLGDRSTSTCVTSYDVDWGDGTVETNVSLPAPHTYSDLGVFNLQVTARGANGCNNTVNYAVQNINNPRGGIGSPGNTRNLCAPTAQLNFSILEWGQNSSDTSYEVDYGDGTIITLYQSDMITSTFYNSADPERSDPFPIPHSYSESSCPTGEGEYSVTVNVRNSCDVTPFSLGGITVLTAPEAIFSAPESVCINTEVLFENRTENAFGRNCSPLAIYEWDFGDGNTLTTLPENAKDVTHTYTSPGTYTVRMSSLNTCGIDDFEMEICVEPALAPQFDLNATEACAPATITATNTTDLSQSCGASTYLWEVSFEGTICEDKSGIWNFTNGTDETSQNPQFLFESVGDFQIQLTESNSCGDFVTTETIHITAPPVVSLDALADSCGPITINPVATVISCANTSETPTYIWTFTGGTPSTSSLEDPGTISYTAPGEYTVSLVVENSCGPSNVATQTFTISEIPSVTNTTFTETICAGTSSSPISLTSDVPGTSFEWTATASPGISGFQASGTGAEIPGQTLFNSEESSGDLTYTVIPSKDGCPGSSVDFTITIEPAPTLTQQPASSEVCLNDTPQELTVETSSTDPSISYQWYQSTTPDKNAGTPISGAQSPNFTPPSDTPGTIYYYALVSFSSGGCNGITSDIAGVTVNERLSITQQPVSNAAVCSGQNLPQPLEIETTGGFGPVSYQWFENSTPATTGGTAITGATGTTFAPGGLTVPGVYYFYVEITSENANCGNAISELVTVTVAQDPVLLNQPVPGQEYCQNATPESLEVLPQGDVEDYLYSWYQNTIDENTGGTLISTGASNSFLPPTGSIGTFYYYAEVSTATSPFCTTVSQTAQVTVTPAPTFSKQPISSAYCLGDTVTALSVAFENGTGTPTYQWYSSTTVDTATGTPIPDAEGSSFTPAIDGTGTRYYYAILNFPSRGCSEIISQPAAITVNPVPEIGDKTDLICSGGTFTLSPSENNGQVVPPGTLYTWKVTSVEPQGAISGAADEGNGQAEISQTLTNDGDAPAIVTYQITPFTSVCSGDPFNLEITVNPGLQANTSVTSSSCFGENNGQITTNISGGIPFAGPEPYQVNWTGPNGFSSSETSIDNLEPGEYFLEIIDDGGCPFGESYTISQPEELRITTEDAQDISCFGADNGSVALNITGGSGNYTYSWIKDGDAFSIEKNLDGLAPGTYEVTVSDGTGCAEKTETFTIAEPALFTGTIDDTINIFCNGESTGAISVTLSGGTTLDTQNEPLPYVYYWTGPEGFSSSSEDLTGIPAGTYDLTATDANGCTTTLSATITQPEAIEITKTVTTIVCDGDNNGSIDVALSGGVPPYDIAWSNFAEGTFLDNLSPGTYTITVTDQEGCQKTEAITIEAPPLFRVEPVVTQISCFGERDGRIELNFQGGSGQIDFEWADDPNAGTTRNNLPPGTYTVAISDSSSCTINESITITEPSGLTLSADIDDAVDCTVGDSGTIDLIVAGGTTPYTYSWSNGSTTEDVTDLTNGNYSVTVTDARGCTAMRTFTINRPQPLEALVETYTDANCEAMEIFQEFVANASGGVPPYTYSWSRGNVSGENGQVMTTEENGFVQLTATDQLGCEATTSFDVNFPEAIGAPDFTFTSGFFEDFGFYSVFDDITFTNLTMGDYTGLSWNFGDGSISTEENPVHSYVSPGTYDVVLTVTYPFGCIYEKSIPLVIEDGYRLIVPNAFTPNNDGMNDRFKPEQLGLEEISLSIYDTWGNMLFSEKGQALEGWDGMVRGRLGENGNYHYRIFGTTFYDKEISREGTLLLVN